MAYMIHTDTPAESLTHLGIGTVYADEGHCFYGWGEDRHDARCPIHTAIRTEDREQAEVLARWLYDRGKQVVVTDADDWSQLWTSANAPILYRAEHQH